ncbi:MAG: AAA family ATPase [Actinobacteria bacterium ATB1]|nr:AAA family ATPase [Actinobacteria bacterium ATB1]
MQGCIFQVRDDFDVPKLESVDLPETRRDDLAMPDWVWAEIDANVHRHLDLIPEFLAAGLGANRSLLLTGPPGTGKTALCRAVAQDVAGRATVLVPEPGIQRGQMSRLYEITAKLAPTVVLLEGVDLVVGDRHGATSTALSEFLEAVDDPATPQVGIITIETANDLSAIDSAARREARLDRIIEVPLPNAGGRKPSSMVA